MNAAFVPLFLASLAGSLHCVAMCGPFLAAVAAPAPGEGPRLSAQLAYHFARLASYLALGALAGLVGGAADLAGSRAGIGRLSALFAGVLLVLWGSAALLAPRGLTRLRRRAPTRLGSRVGALLARFRALPAPARAAGLGLSSALVPCGWLYAFVATAAATGNVRSGAGVLLAFWLGTVPALAAAGLGLRGLLARLGRHARTASASLIVVSGVVLLALRLGAAAPPADVPGTADAPCPLHAH